MAFLAGRLATRPVGVLHITIVCDHITALGLAAVCGTICFTFAEVLLPIGFEA
jgi:hypothetical protein